MCAHATRILPLNRVLESDAKGLTRVPARPSSLAKKEDSKVCVLCCPDGVMVVRVSLSFVFAAA